eukprot:TRINITY_DN14062_c0_g1_i1.p1 TRINITY_DN14062_c0_g1~~TRINITY_DN14062_c0_g1_i1.p1  ORF type:complete len:100 (-),score=8.66 TRINITY_DN14062_c0_g1_i1:351-650(-)
MVYSRYKLFSQMELALSSEPVYTNPNQTKPVQQSDNGNVPSLFRDLNPTKQRLYCTVTSVLTFCSASLFSTFPPKIKLQLIPKTKTADCCLTQKNSQLM